MRPLRHLAALLQSNVLLLLIVTAAYAQSGGGGGGGGGGGPGGPGGPGGGGGSGRDGPGGAGFGGGTNSGRSPHDGLSRSPSSELGRYLNGPEGALAAVRARQALPIDLIVGAARRLTDGKIIDARIVAADDELQYDLKILEANGDVRDYLFQARTGQLVQIR